MNFVKHPRCNDSLGAPEGWNQEGGLPCGALPIQRVRISVIDGYLPAVNSFWKPTDAELKLLNSGSHVKLSVIGDTMAPVMMEVVL